MLALPLLSNDLTQEAVAASLRTRVFGRRLHLLQQTDSTNSALLKLAQAGAEHGTVVCADYQTAGRGRRGRAWFSRPGDGLCFSLLLRGRRLLSDNAHWPAWVPLAGGTAVALGIADTVTVTPALKWPNDLLLDGRKLGGILSESVLTTCQSIIDAQTAEIATMQGWLLEWYNVDYKPHAMADMMEMMGDDMGGMDHSGMEGMPATDPAMMMGMLSVLCMPVET